MSNIKIPFVYILSFMLLSAAHNNSSFAQKNDKRISRLEKPLEEIMTLSNCPGMAVAVVEKDKLIYAKGFGYRDYENKQAVTSNTLFAIGSCTKSFTAALVGQAEKDQKLDLNKRPIDYLPDFSFYNSEMDQLITIRDMLAHNTGLPRHDRSWYYFPSPSRDSLINRIKYHEPTLPVRGGFQYNNFMYMLAGAITEKVSEESWEALVKKQLFEPLEMKHSNLSIDALEKSKDIAYGYTLNKDKQIEKMDYYAIQGMAPAGSINSSANEMAHWLIAWINNGKYNKQEVIPSDFLYEAIGSQVVSGTRFPGKKHPDLHLSNYGFGWDISSYRGHYRVEHGGNIDGFTASTCFYPSDSIGIVVLVNQNYSSVPALVRNTIADQLLNLKSGNWDEPLKEKSKQAKKEEKDDEEEEEKVSVVSWRVQGTQYSHKLIDYTGEYTHLGYGTFYLEEARDSLFAIFPTMRMWLKHSHYDVFELYEVEEEDIDTSDAGSSKINFRSNMNGDIDGVYINLQPGLEPLFFKRKAKVLEIAAEDLELYVGEYDMGGALAKIYLDEENTLKLFVPGQPEYTLIGSKNHVFLIKDLKGFSVEFEEKEGVIEALIFIQPNGNFRVPKK